MINQTKLYKLNFTMPVFCVRNLYMVHMSINYLLLLFFYHFWKRKLVKNDFENAVCGSLLQLHNASIHLRNNRNLKLDAWAEAHSALALSIYFLYHRTDIIIIRTLKIAWSVMRVPSNLSDMRAMHTCSALCTC